jgi:hypothetical protein
MSEGLTSVAIQMQLLGAQDTRVMAPAAYIGEPELHMRIGPHRRNQCSRNIRL